jgi:hypothetical protein
MIRQLKRFMDWLDSRFPPKVVVTEEMLKALRTTIDEHCELLAEQVMFNAKTAAALDKRTSDVNELGHRQDMTIDTLTRIRASYDERLPAIEKSVAGIKDLLAKGGATMLKSAPEALREQFIREGFVRPTEKEAAGV